jgi:hypothetical protein
MATDYADAATVKRMVYENLNISPSTYGTLDTTNKRYKSGYIDDAIIQADIHVLSILLRSKQYNFQGGFFTTTYIPSSTNYVDLDSTSEIQSVFHYTTNNQNTTARSNEVTWEMYDMLSEPLATTSLFPTTGESTIKYGGYYTVRDGRVYIIPIDGVSYNSNVALVNYVTITHSSTSLDAVTNLQSPEGFESAIAAYASATLLMKRADQPEQSTFYLQQFQDFMQPFLTPSSNAPRTTDS